MLRLSWIFCAAVASDAWTHPGHGAVMAHSHSWEWLILLAAVGALAIAIRKR